MGQRGGAAPWQRVAATSSAPQCNASAALYQPPARADDDCALPTSGQRATVAQRAKAAAPGGPGPPPGRHVAHSSVTVPPAAVIFSRAEAENRWAVTLSATPASPSPSTLTSSPARTAPLATRSSGVTSPPCGYSSVSRPVLITW